MELAGTNVSLAVWGARARASLEVPGPGPVWGARASLGCQGRSGVPGPVWGARANPDVPGPLGCQGKSGVPGSVWGAKAITGVPKRV